VRLRFHGEARIEFIAASEWYEEERPGLGDEFVDEVGKGLEAIAAHPDAWPAAARQRRKVAARRFIVPRFPYVLVYAVRSGEIVVLAVAHAKRKPGYWRKRLR
jgi:toxin ParE1/3/4